MAEVNTEAGFVTIDFGSTVPETDVSGQKADFGTLSVVLTTDSGQLTLEI